MLQCASKSAEGKVVDEKVEGKALLPSGSVIPMDGAASVERKRRMTHLMYLGLMIVYVFGGMTFYYLVEGWDPAESLVFSLSILTGVGYGHLVPSTALGMVVTAFYILAGLVLFASIAGQILEFIMATEINAVMDAVKAQAGGGSEENVDTTYRNAQRLDKRRQFAVGCINLVLLVVGAVLLFKLFFGEDLVHAIYLAAVSVLKLDSVCLLDGVKCSHGWHSSGGGSELWLGFAIFWYVLTYGIIGHFMVSASNYLGVDPEASVSKIQSLSHERLQRMDNDGDGRVDRSEFLRDRLIQDGLVDKDAVDAILRNFDRLDKDKNGKLSQADCK
jgi:hypothetical protein